MKHDLWLRIAVGAGFDLDTVQIALLERYEEWLETEAWTSGGIGPGEVERLSERHIADSLLFSRVVNDRPTEVWDLGSGVGLPGLPLAILWPQTAFRLFDRSGRRVDLMKRATRVLDVGNVEVIHDEVSNLSGTTSLVVSRATLTPSEAKPLVNKLLSPNGMAVFAGSWTKQPNYPGWETVEVGTDVLDQPVWLLIMRRR